MVTTDTASLLWLVNLGCIDLEERRELTPTLEKLARKKTGQIGFNGSAPGGPSRWATERTGEWTPLAIELVVQVEYDHFSGGRFRHGTRLMRWRTAGNANLLIGGNDIASCADQEIGVPRTPLTKPAPQRHK